MAGTAAAASGVCHGCGEPVEATDSFCESCGAELAPASVSDGAGGGPRYVSPAPRHASARTASASPAAAGRGRAVITRRSTSGWWPA